MQALRSAQHGTHTVFSSRGLPPIIHWEEGRITEETQVFSRCAFAVTRPPSNLLSVEVWGANVEVGVPECLLPMLLSMFDAAALVDVSPYDNMEEALFSEGNQIAEGFLAVWPWRKHGVIMAPEL